MARFMTREVEGVFQKLRKEAGESDITIDVSINRWNYSHDRDKPKTDLCIAIQTNINGVELFQLDKYSSLEVMVGEALAKIREWKGEEEA